MRKFLTMIHPNGLYSRSRTVTRCVMNSTCLTAPGMCPRFPTRSIFRSKVQNGIKARTSKRGGTQHSSILRWLDIARGPTTRRKRMRKVTVVYRYDVSCICRIPDDPGLIDKLNLILCPPVCNRHRQRSWALSQTHVSTHKCQYESHNGFIIKIMHNRHLGAPGGAL